MKLIITENQRKVILNEISLENKTIKLFQNSSEKISNIIEIAKNIFKEKNIINKLNKILNFNTILFLQPIEELIKSKFSKISNEKLTLILIAVLSKLFINDKFINNNIIKKLNNFNLYSELNEIFKKSKELKNSFKLFIQSLDVSIDNNLIKYLFLVPLIPIIHNLKGINLSDFIKKISEFTSPSISIKILEKIIKKMIKRFNS